MGNIIRLTVAANATHADFIVSMLAAEGIVAEAQLSDMAVASTLGAAPGSAARGDGGMRFILIDETDHERAQELLNELAAESPITPPGAIEFEPRPDAGPDGPPTIELIDSETGASLGHVSDADLQVLVDELEAEEEHDTEFYFNESTLDLLEAAGASATMLNIIARAIAATGEADISWRRLDATPE